MRFMNILLGLVLSIGCAKKTELEAPALKAGWDKETYTAYVDYCKSKLFVSNPAKVPEVCECYTHDAAVAYTPEELDREDAKMDTHLTSILDACGKKSGVERAARLSFGHLLREPLAEPKKIGKGFEKSLEKKKPAHEDKDKAGLIDVRKRPEAVPAGDPFEDLPKPGETFTKLKLTTGSDERTVVFKTIDCTIEDFGYFSDLVVTLENSKTKETLKVRLKDYVKETAHFTSTKSTFQIDYSYLKDEKRVDVSFSGKEKDLKAEHQLTNLRVDEAGLHGKISLKNAPGTTQPPYPFVFGAEGDFHCPVKTVKPKPPST